MCLGVLLVGAAVPGIAQGAEAQEVENLRAFAKLYGYVRFFHPSDEAATPSGGPV